MVLARREYKAAMGLSFSGKEEQRRALMETIFREHYTEIHSFLSNKIRQPEVADDLTSIVFLKAFRWLLEDRGVRQVRSWLYATARTTLADHWQEQLKRASLPLYHLRHAYPERAREPDPKINDVNEP